MDNYVKSKNTLSSFRFFFIKYSNRYEELYLKVKVKWKLIEWEGKNTEKNLRKG